MQTISYAIIGSGALASHFMEYFSLLKIPYRNWARNSADPEMLSIKDCSHILLMISDTAIPAFIQENTWFGDKFLIHFSGTVVLDKVFSCHPLMSFGSSFYSLEQYQKIPFICSPDTNFSQLFPQLPNSWSSLSDDLRPLYHLALTMAGNYTVLLWQFAAELFDNKLNLDPEQLFPYLKQISINIEQNLAGALSGPLKRGDIETLNKHQELLKNSEWLKVYQSFLEAYRSEPIPFQKQGESNENNS